MNKVYSVATTELDAELVEVEADLSSGLRFFRKREINIHGQRKVLVSK